MVKKKAISLDLETKRGLIERNCPDISLERQCALLGIHRSGLYYKPYGPGEKDLHLMHAIDKQYTRTPFYGKRKMAIEMQALGFSIGPKGIRTLMLLMGLEAIYPKPNLSTADKGHKKYPYLMRGMDIIRPDQAWAADITYIPLQHGFAYLIAIIDWYSRYVIEWKLSNLLDAAFCIETLERALEGGIPEFFNTDQGVQFTCEGFTQCLEKQGIKISMDGKGRALDNIFIERLWRSVKYEDVYPKGYEGLQEAREGLMRYFVFYNDERPHQGLGYKKPVEVYKGG
jgi:putative transposase